MSHTSYTNAACDLICRIRDFPLEKLREEIDEKRAKLRALGWPEPDLTLENKLNDYLAEVRALRYQTFDVGTARSGRPDMSESERKTCAECGAPATHWTEASGEPRTLCLIHAAKHPPANMHSIATLAMKRASSGEANG